MLNNIKFHNNQLFSSNIEYPDDDERQCDITLFPFLQFYDMKTDPMTTKIFTQEKNLISANIAQLALLVEEPLVDMNEVI